MQINRLALVRRLLGAATELFLSDADPVSVHCLAASALEHATLIADQFNGGSLRTHVLKTFPEMKKWEFTSLRNRSWTVIKHSHDRSGNEFDISQELADFSDSSNDAVLFAGWHDFAKSGQPLPIEAQVLEVWFFNLYPDSVNPTWRERTAFPGFELLPNQNRQKQKDALRNAIAIARNDPDVMNHQKTDNSPLFVSGP